MEFDLFNKIDGRNTTSRGDSMAKQLHFSDPGMITRGKWSENVNGSWVAVIINTDVSQEPLNLRI